MKLNRNIVLGIFIFIFFSGIIFCSEKNKICPFELISFNAETIRDSINQKLIVNLEWKTSSEMNTDKFVVERFEYDVILLLSEKEFQPIAEIQAAGTSSSVKTYNFTDTLILDLQPVSYRIKGVDKDSSFAYSSEIDIFNFVNVKEKRISNSVSIIKSVYPNPLTATSTLSFFLKENQYISINICDVIGNLVSELINNKLYEAGDHQIQLYSSDLQSGIYYCKLLAGEHFESIKFVVMK